MPNVELEDLDSYGPFERSGNLLDFVKYVTRTSFQPLPDDAGSLQQMASTYNEVFLIRGLRHNNQKDVEMEDQAKEHLLSIDPMLQFDFVTSPEEMSEISSSAVRECADHDYWGFVVKNVPECVIGSLVNALQTTAGFVPRRSLESICGRPVREDDELEVSIRMWMDGGPELRGQSPTQSNWTVTKPEKTSIFEQTTAGFAPASCSGHIFKMEDDMRGFPSDDGCSLGQLASGDANLDIYYAHQFKQNEEHKTTPKFRRELPKYIHEKIPSRPCMVYSYCLLECTPVLRGTMTGSLTEQGKCIATFCVDEAGCFTFTMCNGPEKMLDPGNCSIDLITGELLIAWNSNVARIPATHEVVVNYEYNMEYNMNDNQRSYYAQKPDLETMRGFFDKLVDENFVSYAQTITADQVRKVLDSVPWDVVASEKFHLKSVPIDCAEPTGSRYQSCSNSLGPIIIDANNGLFTLGPNVIIEGKHRWLDAQERGETHILAWVGEKAEIKNES